jgi:hypothetical protein
MQQIPKIILQELADALEPESFRKKKNRFFHEAPSAILWIELQKSRDSTDDRFVFTINLGAFLPTLAKALGEDIREIDVMNGHWNVRLGRLLPSPGDRWWEADSTDQASVIGKEVAGLVKRYGLPELHRAGSVSGLVSFFETGQGIRYVGARREQVFSTLRRLNDT